MRIPLFLAFFLIFSIVQAEVPLKHSKEFQLVLKNEDFLSPKQGFERVIRMLQAIEDDPKFDFKYKAGSGKVWQRHVKSYDTDDSRLWSNNIRPKVEQRKIAANQIETKVKIKYNCMGVDSCYDPKHSISAFTYPAFEYESLVKMKLEADIHQNCTKYALSSAIKVEGTVDFATMADVIHYFKGVTHFKGVEKNEALIARGDFFEWVFDDIKLKVNGERVKGAVVVRYAKTDLINPLKVEFSLKINRPKNGWHYETLIELGQVYYELLQSDMNAFKGRIKPCRFYRPTDSN
ncbi:MAG: hypothetical protein VSS75_032945 [Candidatus Parabeggiatoa sp.]|nr:hypothetical protein [Candidatus Parabeggiatoa sp.]